jgi:hypothetical protein
MSTPTQRLNAGSKVVLKNNLDTTRIIDATHVMIQGQSKERQKQMMARGVPGQEFLPRASVINIADFFVAMIPEIPGTQNAPIGVAKQQKNVTKFLKNPLKGSYCIGVSSYPSDIRAKYLAQTIMSAAIDYYLSHRQKFGTKGLPLWHRVYGGPRDSLRDFNSSERPCMLIIANVHDEATGIKVEKVRDLLEQFSDIPRIVVSGGQPTCDLFAFRLSYPMKAGFYIGPPNLIKEEV